MTVYKRMNDANIGVTRNVTYSFGSLFLVWAFSKQNSRNLTIEL